MAFGAVLGQTQSLDDKLGGYRIKDGVSYVEGEKVNSVGNYIAKLDNKNILKGDSSQLYLFNPETKTETLVTGVPSSPKPVYSPDVPYFNPLTNEFVFAFRYPDSETFPAKLYKVNTETKKVVEERSFRNSFYPRGQYNVRYIATDNGNDIFLVHGTNFYDGQVCIAGMDGYYQTTGFNLPQLSSLLECISLPNNKMLMLNSNYTLYHLSWNKAQAGWQATSKTVQRPSGTTGAWVVASSADSASDQCLYLFNDGKKALYSVVEEYTLVKELSEIVTSISAIYKTPRYFYFFESGMREVYLYNSDLEFLSKTTTNFVPTFGTNTEEYKSTNPNFVLGKANHEPLFEYIGS